MAGGKKPCLENDSFAESNDYNAEENFLRWFLLWSAVTCYKIPAVFTQWTVKIRGKITIEFLFLFWFI